MTRRRSNYDESCWRDRSGLELGLIGFVLAAVVFSIALVVLLTVKIPHSEPNICKTSTCISEATQIAQRIDPSVQPCEDFYKFSCGNFLKDAHGNEKLGAFLSLQEEVQRQLIELYSEPTREDDHQMVTTAKKLFKACMDVRAIDEDGLRTVKEVMRLLGGWPVVNGYWDETKFDWLQATYRIRELGYNSAIFLDLQVIPDPMDAERYIFEIAIPKERNFFRTTDFERKEFMVEIAMLLGAYEKHALAEMMKTIEFAQELHRRNYSTINVEKQHRRFTISEFYGKYGYYINWYEFINNIAGPGVRISPHDFIVFPQTDILNNWFNLLYKTPKRTQANYMIWKVIEETIPFLMEELQQRKLQQTLIPHLIESMETRVEFCLRETQERFSTSPINVMYARRYLTTRKKNMINEIVENIRGKFMDILNRIDWTDERDKNNIAEKAEKMRVIIGAPDNYLDDKVLDDLNVDIKLSVNQTFLNLLAQVNKNYKTSLYRKIYQSKYEAKLNQWFLGTLQDYVLYDARDNVMRIPVTMMQGVFFNADRPTYLNYGGIGTAIGYEFANLFSDEARHFDKNGNKVKGWSNKTMEAFTEKTKCTLLDFEYFKLKKNNFLTEMETRQILALKLAYEALENFINNNGEEAQLIGSRYTPKQLFWIEAAFITCKPTNFYDSIFRVSEDVDYFSFLVFGPMRNNPNFAQDFRCPAGSRMYPFDTCKIF